MLTEHSTKTRELLQRLQGFFDQHIYPNEERHAREMDAFRRAGNPWQQAPVVEELKILARKAGLWNMFLPHPYKGQGGISKVVAPNVSCKVVDWAIQAHGAAGVSQDFWLAEAYAHQRTVRIVDGPDEVHRNAIAKIELGRRALRKSA